MTIQFTPTVAEPAQPATAPPSRLAGWALLAGVVVFVGWVAANARMGAVAERIKNPDVTGAPRPVEPLFGFDHWIALHQIGTVLMMVTLVVAFVIGWRRHPGRDHDRRDQQRLPDERELVPLAGREGPPRDHVRVDVQLRAHEEDLEHRVEDESEREDQAREAQQWVPPHDRVELLAALQPAQHDDRGEERRHVERRVADHDERFDGR